jgi:hypothetical protein
MTGSDGPEEPASDAGGVAAEAAAEPVRMVGKAPRLDERVSMPGPSGCFSIIAAEANWIDLSGRIISVTEALGSSVGGGIKAGAAASCVLAGDSNSGPDSGTPVALRGAAPGPLLTVPSAPTIA